MKIRSQNFEYMKNVLTYAIKISGIFLLIESRNDRYMRKCVFWGHDRAVGEWSESGEQNSAQTC